MLQNLLVHLNNPAINTVSELFFRSQMAPLDFNLALWEANNLELVTITDNDIEYIGSKEDINPLASMDQLHNKLYLTVKHYDDFKKYIPEVEFFSWSINAYQDEVYQRSNIIGALNWLEDAGLIHSVEAQNPADADKENANKFRFYYITEQADGVSSLFEAANQEKQAQTSV